MGTRQDVLRSAGKLARSYAERFRQKHSVFVAPRVALRHCLRQQGNTNFPIQEEGSEPVARFPNQKAKRSLDIRRLPFEPQRYGTRQSGPIREIKGNPRESINQRTYGKLVIPNYCMAITSTNRVWARLDGVDVLRALAIFFVLMNHVNMRLRGARVPYLAHVPQWAADALVWNAQRGVQMFFVVSGFLITSTALRRWDSISGVRVWEFYKLRFARIAPLMLLVLAALSLLHIVHANHYVIPEKTGGLRSALFAALTFRVNVLEARRGYLSGSWDILWSLSVEEMFYLFFPLACRLMRSTRVFVSLLLVLVVLGPFGRTVLAHGNEVWHEYSYLGCMDAIAMGCVTALLLQKRKLTEITARLCASIGGAMLILALGFSFTSSFAALEKAGLDMSLLALGTCLVIVAVVQTHWTAPIAFRPLLSLGRHSYEIYLTHMFVVFLAFDLFTRMGRPMFAVPLFFGVVVVAGSLLGALVAHFYSEPMNRSLRRRYSPPGQSVLSVVPAGPAATLAESTAAGE